VRRAIIPVVLAAALGACAIPAASPSPTSTSTPVPAATRPAELTIYGAASLKGMLEAAKAAYETTVGGVSVVISTDSSAALATQIEQGAPADLFLSADTANPQRLVDEGLVAGEALSFAANELALVIPDENPGDIEDPRDLAASGVEIIAAGDDVPITTYATALVRNLATRPGYPADFEARYEANIVSREENVTAIVAKLQLGEGHAGIVYATDAIAGASGQRIRTVPIPAGANVPVTYAAVIIGASPNQVAAQAFLDWLQGPEGLSILQGLGFQPPPE
jgi:molybdate transport system substrate-binding protein